MEVSIALGLLISEVTAEPFKNVYYFFFSSKETYFLFFKKSRVLLLLVKIRPSMLFKEKP